MAVPLPTTALSIPEMAPFNELTDTDPEVYVTTADGDKRRLPIKNILELSLSGDQQPNDTIADYEVIALPDKKSRAWLSVHYMENVKVAFNMIPYAPSPGSGTWPTSPQVFTQSAIGCGRDGIFDSTTPILFSSTPTCAITLNPGGYAPVVITIPMIDDILNTFAEADYGKNILLSVYVHGLFWRYNGSPSVLMPITTGFEATGDVIKTNIINDMKSYQPIALIAFGQYFPYQYPLFEKTVMLPLSILSGLTSFALVMRFDDRSGGADVYNPGNTLTFEITAEIY